MIVAWDQGAAFAAAALVVIAAPGPDNLATLSIGLSHGRRAAMGFGAGCGVGCLSHTTWAVLGVSAVLATSAAAFTALKLAGAAYLLWLGIRAFRPGPASLDVPAPAASGARRFFVRGLVANAVNPKVALFFLAFLPQFVRPEGRVGAQMAVLGVTFTALSLAAFVALGHFSGKVGGWLRRRPGAGRWLERATGCLFVGLGIRLAASGR